MPLMKLELREYRCEPCRKDGLVTRELVRMAPRSAIVAGELVLGPEWWCCPVCFTKVQPVRRTKTGQGRAAASPA